MRTLVTCTVLALLLRSGRASAGAPEELDAIFVNPTDPHELALRYFNGGGGMLLSSDEAKTFRFLCASAIDLAVGRHGSSMVLRADGSVSIGVTDGLWSGDAHGCGFTRVKSFEGLWVNEFAIDPIDPKITYATTSSGGKQNGIYRNTVANSTWTPFGSQAPILLNRLRVVALPGAKRRFYESAVHGSYDSVDPVSGQPISDPKYVIRVSEDDGETWVEHEFGHIQGELRLETVDPLDPDHIIVSIQRGDALDFADAALDDLWSSSKQGGAGSFVLVGQVTRFGGVAFVSDGRMFYGDFSQNTPALYMLAKPGDKAKQVSHAYAAGCVKYDAQSDRLYACADRMLGTIDPNSAAFSQLYDMSKAESFVQCKGEPLVADRCQEQLLTAYCGMGHFPQAPLCARYYSAPDAGNGAGSASDAAVSGNTTSGAGGCGCRVYGARGVPGARAIGCWFGGLLVALLSRRRRAG